MSILRVLITLATLLLVDCSEGSPPKIVVAGQDWYLVESGDPHNLLWRFKTGPDEGEGLTLGDTHVCLFQAHEGKFLGPDERLSLSLGSPSCNATERFQIQWASGENAARLVMHDERSYLSCNEVGVQGTVDAATDFKLYTDETNAKLWLQSGSGETGVEFVQWLPELEAFVCSDLASAAFWGSFFTGWKTGEEGAWTPRDEVDVIGSFDNCASSTPGTVSYLEKVGTEVVDSKAWTASPDITIATGKEVERIFKKSDSLFFGEGWEQERSALFEDLATRPVTLGVPPNTKAEVVQIVGRVGPVTVHSDFFASKEIECDNGQPRHFENGSAKDGVAETIGMEPRVAVQSRLQ